MKKLSTVIALIVSLNSMSFAVEPTGPSLAPRELRCEHRITPLGIGETKPRLDWKAAALDATARDLRQTAYRILVATSPDTLARNEGDLWDSGRVESNSTANVAYQGKPLGSRQACWWKVQIWDQAGQASRWSEPARWTMGLLDPFDWQAEWIGLDLPLTGEGVVSDEQRARLAGMAWVGAPVEASRTEPRHALFRKAIVVPVDRPIRQATVLLTPDMRCEMTINGKPVAEVTRWDRAVPLSIAAALVAGENVIGLSLTQDDGYPPAVLGEVEIRFAGGETVLHPIDTSWRCATTAAAGWDQPGFDATSWNAVVPLTGAKGKLRASPWNSPQNALHTLTPPPLLRKSFTLQKPIQRATVYATALGVYELHLNGTRVGQDYLTPGWTEYHHRVHYQTYDVTPLLQQGANALGATLGDGWFASLAGYTGKRGVYGGKPRVRAQLEIEYTDGSREVVKTDASWRGGVGAVKYADLYLGCAYDARLDAPNWATSGFDDRKWKAVVTGLPVGSPHNFVVEASTVEPVRVIEEMPVKKVSEPVAGRYVFDLGQNIVGWVRLKVSGKPGQKITVRHGEMLNPNGTLYTSNLRGASATDVYWLRGDGEETLEPFATFHGFQYAEVTGLDAPPSPQAVTGIVIHNPMKPTGAFTCSEPLLNQLFKNIVWGQKGNYLEAPTDCPQRDERLGWTGDTQFFIRTGLFNFDAQDFIERWLTTLITDSQGENGAFPSTAPSVGHVPTVVTAWGDAALLCTHALWQVYGDTRIIERHYDRLGLYINALRARAKDGIVSIGGYGDWLNLGGGAKREVMDTAYYAHLCGLMSDMGKAIGRNADAEKYATEQNHVRTAWQRAFLKPDGSILESSQTGFALAFTMDLIPEDMKARAADQFVGELRKKDWHLATGFIGTPRLLPALHVAGRNDAAYRLLQTKTYPSWLFQVTLGATTMWERWDGWTPDRGFQTIDMNSFNHYAFGAVAEFLYRHVLGIDTHGAGFRDIVIAPQPGGTLTSASGHYDAITGRIATDWRHDGSKLTLRVQVPPNTRALVRVPTTHAQSVREGGRSPAQSPGVRFDHAEPGAAVYSVGSGQYEFTSAYTPQPPAE